MMYQVLDEQHAGAVQTVGDLGALGLPALALVQKHIEINHRQRLDLDRHGFAASRWCVMPRKVGAVFTTSNFKLNATVCGR